MPFISLNGKKLTLDELSSHTTKTSFEEDVLSFISEWQNGKEYFTQQTSGSTGTPKIIELTRSQMMASAMMTIKALDLKPEQNALLCLSPQYIGGKMMIIRSLINKMNLIAVEPTSNPFVGLNEEIHFAALTPMQMQLALTDKLSTDNIKAIDNIILGGGPVSEQLIQLINEVVNGSCYSTYGMTETSSHIALKKLNGKNKSNYFTAFDEVEINQDDRDCLTITGAITNFETVITNDRVNLISANQFEWLGRYDNVINSGGIKIQSEKVERVVEKYFQSKGYKNRFFVAGLPDELLGQKASLIIERTSHKLPKSLLEDLRKLLPEYHNPKDMIFVDHFTETPTGKVNRIATLSQVI